MYAMHYDIRLPADHDMNVIRARVARTGAALDSYPGLGLKAYLMAEAGVAGATTNRYAPFYLWADADGMNRFLWGGGAFSAIVKSFPRPQVSHWTGVSFSRGHAIETMPAWAALQRTALTPESDPTFEVEQAVAEADGMSSASGCHSVAVGIDPSRWEAGRFSLWRDIPPVTAGTIFQVLHLSRPGLSSLSAWHDREAFART